MLPRAGQDSAHRRPGFTITEVLVASTLAALVVAGTYAFFARSARTFSTFVGLGIVEERVSLASETMMNDVRVAGMYGTPHSGEDPLVCPKPAQVLRAVEIEDGASLADHDWGLNGSHIDPDRCVLMVPVTPNLFRPATINGNVITLTNYNLPIGMPAEDFDQLFDQRLLRIASPSGFNQFVTVTATDDVNRSLVVSPAPARIDDLGLCGVVGIGGPDHEISVLTHVRYSLIEDPDDAERTLLIREDLRPDLATIVPGSRVVVAENVVDLQCWADDDEGSAMTGASFQEDSSLGDDQGSADNSTMQNNTQRLRVFHYRMVGRTDREFPFYSLQPRATDDDLLTTFDVDGQTDTAALALTVGQRIELTNFTVRNLR